MQETSKRSLTPKGVATRRYAFSLLIGFLCLAWIGMTKYQTQRVIRVGVYESPPKIFTDSNGVVSGFWSEIIHFIAEKENWEIEWVHGTWEENMQRLKNNEIDILPDTGWSEARAKEIDFSSDTILVSWARVYVPKRSTIETILDLEGKRIGGLSGSLNFDGPEGIKAITNKFNVHCSFVLLKNYNDVFAALESGLIDAGVTNKDYGDQNESNFSVKKTPILFQPTSLRFSFTKGAESTPYLIGRIDSHMRNLKADSNSFYYQAVDRYLGEESQKNLVEIIPSWVYILFFGTSGIILFLLFVSLLTRHQVKRQTAKLRASEFRYRALLENIPDQIFRINREGILLDYHTVSGNFFFQNPQEFVGKNINEALLPSLAENTLQLIDKTMETGEIQISEFQAREDSETRDYEARFSISGENEVITIIRDISENKRGQRELIESEQRYQTLARVVPVGIFSTNRFGETTYVNPTWCHLSGMSAEESMGNGWLEAVHPDDRVRIESNWKKRIQKQGISSDDYRFIHPDGSISWVIGQAVPELNTAGEIVGYIGTITDITERKKIEELQEALIKAESADRMKSAFLATMSHELRTPLNSIIGFTGIILQKLVGPLNEEQEKQLTMVMGSARHLLALINDVLDISKVEAGQVVIVKENFYFEMSVQRSVEKVRTFVDGKGLKLSVSITPSIIEINSDQRRVEQILINLLNNAIKFTEHGEINLESRIEDNFLITSVSDTGIGIKPEDLSVLFKPFQQLETGINRRFDGTGLGLSICKRLVELLGGEIWVDSEWGKGSTFTFTLPLELSKKDES